VWRVCVCVCVCGCVCVCVCVWRVCVCVCVCDHPTVTSNEFWGRALKSLVMFFIGRLKKGAHSKYMGGPVIPFLYRNPPPHDN
jgi:hypothetical protein